MQLPGNDNILRGGWAQPKDTAWIGASGHSQLAPCQSICQTPQRRPCAITALLSFTDLAVFPPGAPTQEPIIRLGTGTIQGGERVALTGPSGIGKSTLLRGLVRLNPISAARYQINEQDGRTLAPRTLRRACTYIAQVPMALAGDAIENGRLALHYGGPLVEAWEAQVSAMLLMVGLEEVHWRKEAGSLSVGQRMRLAIARGLLVNPSILLLDEPFAPLDTAARDIVLEALSKWVDADHALVAILHERSDVERLATTVWEMPDRITLRAAAMEVTP